MCKEKSNFLPCFYKFVKLYHSKIVSIALLVDLFLLKIIDVTERSQISYKISP